MSNINTSQFFKTDYIDFSVYDNVRKIASYVDGLKNSTRKVTYTLLETNCDSFVKVSNLGPRVQDFSQYLHGSLEGGIVNMTQNYMACGNNLPLLVGDGNFGTRFIPQAAASRYIFAKANPITKSLFRKDDNVNLKNQVFEGDKIEPLHYMPVLPFILANQQQGMSIGFAQNILPRDVEQLKKWVLQKAQGKRITADLTPYWNDQDFTVTKGETDLQWVVTGSFERVTSTKLRITSLPVGYNLKSYEKVLDKLTDDKVIRDYEDLSDNDHFCFDIIAPREFIKLSDDKLIDKLKLQKKYTENFTCVDENNKVRVFGSVKEMLESWWSLRLEYNTLRKEYLLDTLSNDINACTLKMLFIKSVLEESINIKDKEANIFKQAAECSDKLTEEVVKRFLRLPIRQLSKEQVVLLSKELKSLKDEKTKVSNTPSEQFSVQDIESL